MPKHVFTYGSLMFPQVWRQVVQGRYASTSAYATNILRRKMIGDTYPAAQLSPDSHLLHGRIYFNVTSRDMQRLDKFEGRYYQRCRLVVYDKRHQDILVDTYLLRQRYASRISQRPWCPREFAGKHLRAFLVNHNRHRYT